MKKFFVLYLAPSGEFKKMIEKAATLSQKERDEGMKVWERWMSDNKSAVVDVGGAVGKTMRVTKEGSRETHNDVGGYNVIQAASYEDAAKIAASSPHLDQVPGAWIEVMEILEMPAA